MTCFASDTLIEEHLEDAVERLKKYEDLEWRSVELSYKPTDSKGIGLLTTNESALLTVDPGMTAGLIESCNFNNFDPIEVKEIDFLVKNIPKEGSPALFFNRRNMTTYCRDDAQYYLRIYSHKGVRTFIYSQEEECAGETPNWLTSIVEKMDELFRKHKDCAWNLESIKK